MKKLIFGIVLIVMGGGIAHAVVSTSVEVLPLGVSSNQIMITPDYFAAWNEVSFYGFVEFTDGGWFTSHGATWLPIQHAGVYTEAALDDAGGTYFSFGPSLSIPMAGFVYLKMTPKLVLGSPERRQEVSLVWRTAGLSVLGGELWSEGFIRTFRDVGNSYGQPQVWWKKKDSLWEFGLEVEVAGDTRILRGGIRKRF